MKAVMQYGDATQDCTATSHLPCANHRGNREKAAPAIMTAITKQDVMMDFVHPSSLLTTPSR